MAVIKSGASSDELTVDATAKAARVTLYDTTGRAESTRDTYAAATTASFAAAAGAAMFFVITGSASKTIFVRRIRISGATLTTLAVNGIAIEKWSTAPTGGTATALTQTPLDSADAAATATLCQVYTVAPTEGTLVGTIGSVRHIYKSSTVVDGADFSIVQWDFGGDGMTGVALRGSSQGLSAAFVAAPATAVTLQVEVMWTEE